MKLKTTAFALLTVAWLAASPSVEEELLTLGYALAGSGYENSPKYGMQQTLALTNFFKGKVGNPSRVIVWGNSLGGLVALKLVEEHPGVYDGAIANCAPCAGRAENAEIEYALTPGEKTYLGSLGVDADALLAAMNERANITARRSARNHVEQWGGLTGRLQRPVGSRRGCGRARRRYRRPWDLTSGTCLRPGRSDTETAGRLAPTEVSPYTSTKPRATTHESVRTCSQFTSAAF